MTCASCGTLCTKGPPKYTKGPPKRRRQTRSARQTSKPSRNCSGKCATRARRKPGGTSSLSHVIRETSHPPRSARTALILTEATWASRLGSGKSAIIGPVTNRATTSTTVERERERMAAAKGTTAGIRMRPSLLSGVSSVVSPQSWRSQAELLRNQFHSASTASHDRWPSHCYLCGWRPDQHTDGERHQARRGASGHRSRAAKSANGGPSHLAKSIRTSASRLRYVSTISITSVL